MKRISLWAIEDEPMPTLHEMACIIAEATDAGVDIDARPTQWWNRGTARYEWVFETPEDLGELTNQELTQRIASQFGPMMSGEAEELWAALMHRLENS